MKIKNGWAVVYKRAINKDGSLLFPERLTKEFLDNAKRTMGSYLFANQYQNEIIPEEKQVFKKAWLKKYVALPEVFNTFAFIDPAISTADTADYTGVAVVSVDVEQNWYVRFAVRLRINPSQLIELCFKLYDQFKCAVIGIEDIAFQKAIVHFALEEMKRRARRIPISGIKRGTDKTKQTRILGLVPRFEWGTIYLNHGLEDLEMELLKFPRSQHDDILDALASIEQIVHYPQKKRSTNEQPAPNDPNYESWYIHQYLKRASRPYGYGEGTE